MSSLSYGVVAHTPQYSTVACHASRRLTSQHSTHTTVQNRSTVAHTPQYSTAHTPQYRIEAQWHTHHSTAQWHVMHHEGSHHSTQTRITFSLTFCLQSLQDSLCESQAVHHEASRTLQVVGTDESRTETEVSKYITAHKTCIFSTEA